MSGTYTRVDAKSDLVRAINGLIDRDAGLNGADAARKIRWVYYDGIEKDPQTGATLSSNNYTQVVRNTVGNHIAVLKSGTSPTATPSAANSVILVQDSGVTIGSSLALSSATAGTPIALSIAHTDNTADASHAQLNLQTGGGTGGDPSVSWAVSGGGSFAAGIDNDDGDAWVLVAGVDLTTGKRIRIDGTDIRLRNTNFYFQNAGGTSTYLEAIPPTITWYGTGAAGSVSGFDIRNTDNTNAASHARQFIRVGGLNAGDAFTSWQIDGVAVVSAGIDTSLSLSVGGGAWVVSAGSTLGTNDMIRADAIGSTKLLSIGTVRFEVNSTGIAFFAGTPVAKQSAFTQTFSTADRTIAAYTADPETVAYTGITNAAAGAVFAQVADLNALRVAYETLRAHAEDIGQGLNAVIDTLQAYNLV